jgi:hypothetical protein
MRGRVALACTVSLALALLSIVALGAHPAQGAPACGLFTAPSGDAPNNANGGDGSNVDNLDVIGGGIASDDSQTMTVEVDVKNLTNDIPSNATSVNWYFQWTGSDGTNYWGRAVIDLRDTSTPLYSVGTFDATTGRYTSTASTTGSFQTGTAGAVRVNVPLSLVGAPAAGSQLTQTYGITFIGQGAPGVVSSLSQIDRGPKDDTAYGQPYTVGSCSGASPTPSGGPPKSPRAAIRFQTLHPKKGSVDKATASLKACTGNGGTKIQLQQKKGSAFKTIATKKMSSACKAIFKVKANFSSATFRSYWPKQNPAYKSGASKPQTVKTK